MEPTQLTVTRIDLPLPDNGKRRNTVCKECYLVLKESTIHYKVVADYESPDADTEIWTAYVSNWRWTRQRSALSDINMFYCNKADRWLVGIEFNGVANPMEWEYDDPKEALKIYTQLSDYMITR